MSPGMYSPIIDETEPAWPSLIPLIVVMMSFSLRPALAAGPSVITAEYCEAL